MRTTTTTCDFCGARLGTCQLSKFGRVFEFDEAGEPAKESPSRPADQLYDLSDVCQKCKDDFGKLGRELKDAGINLKESDSISNLQKLEREPEL